MVGVNPTRRTDAEPAQESLFRQRPKQPEQTSDHQVEEEHEDAALSARPWRSEIDLDVRPHGPCARRDESIAVKLVTHAAPMNPRSICDDRWRNIGQSHAIWWIATGRQRHSKKGRVRIGAEQPRAGKHQH